MSADSETTPPSVHELLAGKTREQIIDAWMEDKMFFQAQVRRLQGIVRELYAAHGKAHDIFRRSAMDVVLKEQKPEELANHG
jgi:hypothetical protein